MRASRVPSRVTDVLCRDAYRHRLELQLLSPAQSLPPNECTDGDRCDRDASAVGRLERRRSGAHHWWIDASERVRAHEAEHLQIAVDAAAEIRSLLMRKTSSDCNLLRQSANDEAGLIFARERERQIKLDRRTRHGTVLPAAR